MQWPFAALDTCSRQFQVPRPNALWVSDFTFVLTWSGFVYVAFPIDALARRMVSRHVSRSARADFGLDALEQALHDRQPLRQANLIHHGDGGVQYGSILYTERLIDPGIEPSVGSVVDPYDNPVAEPVIGLFKAEVVHWCGPWRSFEVVEFAMLE